jgi:AcrR family transcriptional regulator
MRSEQQRATAEERRDQVLEAAIHVFAESGYHAAKTADIAKRAGISQPYIYALFDDKKALFLAAQERVRHHIREAFSAAYRQVGPGEDRLAAMGASYRKLLRNPDAPRCQLQGYAASADPEIADFMRQGYMMIFEIVQRLTGLDRQTVARFMAAGLLLNLGTVLDLPETYTATYPLDTD